MGEGDKMDKMINVKRTIAEFKRWPGVVNGYTNLTLFTGFFMLYVYILLEQQDISDSHKIDFMVRSALLDQDGALSKVNTEGDLSPTTEHAILILIPNSDHPHPHVCARHSIKLIAGDPRPLPARCSPSPP